MGQDITLNLPIFRICPEVFVQLVVITTSSLHTSRRKATTLPLYGTTTSVEFVLWGFLICTLCFHIPKQPADFSYSLACIIYGQLEAWNYTPNNYFRYTAKREGNNCFHYYFVVDYTNWTFHSRTAITTSTSITRSVIFYWCPIIYVLGHKYHFLLGRASPAPKFQQNNNTKNRKGAKRLQFYCVFYICFPTDLLFLLFWEGNL